MESSLPLLKTDHITAGLRAIARHFKQNDREEVKRLKEEKTFNTIVEKLQESIEDLSETCIVDLLFFFRKTSRVYIQLGFNMNDVNAVIKKADGYIVEGKYNFNQLVNLNYDLSLLNRSLNSCLTSILQKLRADGKVLTAFNCQMLINSAVAKSNKVANDYVLLEYICRTTDIILTEYDNEQKSWIFRNLAKLEFPYYHPKFRNPVVLYQLKTYLKENLNQLSEMAVLNIIQAYSFVNKDFPYDLLDEIKVMVMITLQHNSSNLKSSFLLDFLDRCSSLPRNRTLTSDRVHNLLDEISTRFESDIYISRNHTRLLKIMKQFRTSHPKLMQQIEEHNINDPNATVNLMLLEFLSLQQHDLSPILKSLKEKNAFENCNLTSLMRLRMLLDYPNEFDYQEFKDFIDQMEIYKNKEENMNNVNLLYVSNSRQLRYNEEILDLLIDHFVKKKTGKFMFENFFRLIVGRNVCNKMINLLKDSPETIVDNLNHKDFRLVTDLFLTKFNDNTRVENNAVVYLA